MDTMRCRVSGEDYQYRDLMGLFGEVDSVTLTVRNNLDVHNLPTLQVPLIRKLVGGLKQFESLHDLYFHSDVAQAIQTYCAMYGKAATPDSLETLSLEMDLVSNDIASTVLQAFVHQKSA
jgi:hypothetical protein